MTRGRKSARLKPVIGTPPRAASPERRADRRGPAIFEASRPAEAGGEILDAFRSTSDGVYRIAGHRPWLGALVPVAGGIAAFAAIGVALAAELESVFIGLIGACILFLIAVSIGTSLGGSSARGR